MGCDVHMHVEVKVGGRWEHYSHPRIQRNYRLFGLLAGVRNTDVLPIVEPKGLPEDMSLITKTDYEYYKDEGHTESWFNRNEIRELFEVMDEDCDLPDSTVFGYANGNCLTTIGELDSGHPGAYEEVRLVFWFDN